MRNPCLLATLGSVIVLACSNAGPGRDQQRAHGSPGEPPTNSETEAGIDPHEEDDPGEGPSGDPPTSHDGGVPSSDGGATPGDGGGTGGTMHCDDKVRVVTEGLVAPQDLAVDTTHVYLTTGAGSTPGSILRVAKTGGTATVLQSGRMRPAWIRVDGSFVYWSEEHAPNWFIYRASTTGGDVPQLLSDDASSGKFVVDSTHVFYGAAASAGLKSVLKSGGGKTTLTSASPFHIAVDESHVYFNHRSGSDETRVSRIAKAGGPTMTIATVAGGGDEGFEASGDVLVDAERAYWTVFAAFGDPPTGDLRLMSAPKSGGTASLVSMLPRSTGWLELRDSNFFFTNTDADDARRMARTGGAPAVLGSYPNTQTTIAVDGACVWWLSQSPTPTAASLVTVRR